MIDDILNDPSFAGLHWSIPPDTPPEWREQAHRAAAHAARSERERNENRTVYVLLQDLQCARQYVLWPNGSCTWETDLSLANLNLRVIRG